MPTESGFLRSWRPAPHERAPAELMKPITDPAAWYPAALKGIVLDGSVLQTPLEAV